MMQSLNTLWKKRFSNYTKELGKYGKLIFNDHLSIILFVLLGFGAIAYQNLLTQISELGPGQGVLPVVIISIFLLWLIFLMGQPLWLTKPADISYLFPRGHAFDNYWLKGTLIGVLFPVISLVMLGILVYPFIVSVTFWEMELMWLFLFWLILARIISGLIYYLAIYQMPFTSLMRLRSIHGLVFIILLFFLLLLPLKWGNIIVGLIFAIIMIWICSQMRKRNQYAIDFNYVVKSEEQRQANFYRLISLFVDVPTIKPEIKRQKYLDHLFLKLPHLNRNRYGFLFIRQLFRNNLYRSIWIKVTLFMAVIIFLIDIPWLIGLAGITGMFMTVIQLLPLLYSYDTHPFQQIYSNNEDNKLFAFQQSIFIILMIQLAIFLISALISSGWGFWIIGLILIWGLFILGILYVYIPWWSRRTQKHK